MDRTSVESVTFQRSENPNSTWGKFISVMEPDVLRNCYIRKGFASVEVVFDIFVDGAWAGWSALTPAKDKYPVLGTGIWSKYRDKGLRTKLRLALTPAAKELGAIGMKARILLTNPSHAVRLAKDPAWQYVGCILLPTPGYFQFLHTFKD